LGVFAYNRGTDYIVFVEIRGWKEAGAPPPLLALTGHEYIHF
jgi:hypothetical protein